jgi:hypothetical protein
VGRENHAPFSLGVENTGNGSFHTFIEIRIWPQQPSDVPVVIRATDHHGVTAVDTTFGFSG